MRPRLSAEKRNLILELVRAGNYYVTACRAAGISERAFYKWKRLGTDELARREQGHDPDPNLDEHVQFVQALTRAENESESRLVALWAGAANNDWRAARDLLARRFPDRWADRSKVELTGADGGAVQVESKSEVELTVDPVGVGAVLDAMADAGLIPAAPDTDGGDTRG